MRRLFPTALLGGEGLERLLAVAERLPLCVIDQPFGFEFALDGEAADADFCVVAVPGAPLAAHYVREGAGAPPGSAAAALGACLDPSAAGPASFLAGRGGGLILEYDVPCALSAPPSRPLEDEESSAPPGFFFVPRGNTREDAGELLDDPAETAAALWAGAGWSAEAGELRQFERVFEILSGSGLIAQAGVLPGRPLRAVRLVAHRIDSADLPGLLKRLQWPGSVDAAMSVVADTSDLVQAGAVLSLDVSASGVSPRLGMELFRPADQSRLDPTGWRPIIARLEEKGWCLPAKAQGLRAWSRAEPVFGPDGVFRVWQYVNHFKAVVLDGRVTAKAYVAMVIHGLRK